MDKSNAFVGLATELFERHIKLFERHIKLDANYKPIIYQHKIHAQNSHTMWKNYQSVHFLCNICAIFIAYILSTKNGLLIFVDKNSLLEFVLIIRFLLYSKQNHLE